MVDEQTAAPVDTDRLARLAEFVLADQQVPGGMELTVLCVDEDRIAELNHAHMGAQGPTDVLAFPLDDPTEMRSSMAVGDDEASGSAGPPGLLGDVVLCPSIAADQAADLGRTPQQEVDLLVVHGILHVLGHDHAEDDERAEMFGLTDRLLADFGAMTAGGAT